MQKEEADRHIKNLIKQMEQTQHPPQEGEEADAHADT